MRELNFQAAPALFLGKERGGSRKCFRLLLKTAAFLLIAWGPIANAANGPGPGARTTIKYYCMDHYNPSVKEMPNGCVPRQRNREDAAKACPAFPYISVAIVERYQESAAGPVLENKVSLKGWTFADIERGLASKLKFPERVNVAGQFIESGKKEAAKCNDLVIAMREIAARCAPPTNREPLSISERLGLEDCP